MWNIISVLTFGWDKWSLCSVEKDYLLSEETKVCYVFIRIHCPKLEYLEKCYQIIEVNVINFLLQLMIWVLLTKCIKTLQLLVCCIPFAEFVCSIVHLAFGQAWDCISLSVRVQSVKYFDPNWIVLSSLCRVLYGNKITELPKGLFDGLVSLQLL